MYKYAADGIVPGFKIGGRIWRFKKSKVDEWMDQQSDNEERLIDLQIIWLQDRGSERQA